MTTFKPMRETRYNNRIGEKEISIRFSYISFHKSITMDHSHVQLLIADTEPQIELRFNSEEEGYKIQTRPQGETACIATRSSVKKIKTTFDEYEVEGRHEIEKINNLTYRITFKQWKKNNTAKPAGKE